MRVTRTLILSAAIIVAGLLAGGAVADDPEQPLAGVRIAYVHLNQQDEREAWADFLTAQGATFTGVPVALVTTTNWAQFDVIIVAHDTYNFQGTNGRFGPPGFDDSDAVFASGLPIVAIWDGASIFDDIPSLTPIGRDEHAGSDSRSVTALPARFWNLPLNNGVVPGEDVAIVDPFSSAPSDALYWVDLVSDELEIYGLVPQDSDRSLLSGLGQKYRVWAFAAPPGELTETGRRVFINYLLSVFPQPDLEHEAFVPGAARAP